MVTGTATLDTNKQRVIYQTHELVQCLWTVSYMLSVLFYVTIVTQTTPKKFMSTSAGHVTTTFVFFNVYQAFGTLLSYP